jgi:hypothetical protein
VLILQAPLLLPVSRSGAAHGLCSVWGSRFCSRTSPPPSLCADARTSPHLSRLGDRTADRAQLWRVASVISSHARTYAGVLGPCLRKLAYMSHVV